jgi:hypothetical protein
MIKRIYLYFIFFFAMLSLNAQTYGNEWIDYNKTYYKFGVKHDGLVRIPYSSLASAGIPPFSILGDDFKLFRNGKEVPIFVSTEGLFGNNDYIEFFTYPQDQEVDAALFQNPENRLNPTVSLFNDTAYYFLGIYPGLFNNRIVNGSNDFSNLPAKEIFYWHKETKVNRDRWFQGELISSLYNFLTDPAYDNGEGFSGTEFIGPSTRSVGVAVNNIYTGGPTTAKLTSQVEFTNITDHFLTLNVGSYLKNFSNTGFGLKTIEEVIPLSDITNGTTNVNYVLNIDKERATVAYATIEYPREYIFTGISKQKFNVQKSGRLYFEFQNFLNNGTSPLMYDLKNNKRYTAQVENTTSKIVTDVTFNPTDEFFVTSQSSTDIINVPKLTPTNFTNFSNINKQANYLIISNKALTTPFNGENQIERYNAYRSSADGGSKVSHVYYIDELTDQFAFGIRHHPLAVRNFINYALDVFNIQPQSLFILGKGFPYNETKTDTFRFNRNLIPTYGNPCSDNMLASRNPTNKLMQIPVGRLGASTTEEVSDYLDKIISYENVQRDTSELSQKLDNKEWMKRVLHIGGGTSEEEQAQFKYYLNNYRSVIEGDYFGGTVHNIFKTINEPIQVAQTFFLDSLINTGLSLITFFGHSATSSVDFNILPENFKNKDRYHFMLSNGCFIGNIFGKEVSYSDKFILSKEKGAVGYLAPYTYSLAPSLNIYSSNFYRNIGVQMYGEEIGNIIRQVHSEVETFATTFDKMLAHQFIYHGDPAIRINPHSRPDYVITPASIKFVPDIINATVDSFKLVVNTTNIGRTVAGFYTVQVERSLPNGQIEVYEQIVQTPYFKDSVVFIIPTNRGFGLGDNSFTIKVDYLDEYNEMSESNNEVIINKLFLSDDIIPVFPSEFSILTNANTQLIFSTVGNNTNTRTYILQIDTTGYFDSPLLLQTTITQPGGVIQWTPNITYLPGKVYYFRGGLQKSNPNEIFWKTSSFKYDPSLSPGWNQSHYFQFLRDDFNTMELPVDRQFKFSNDLRSVRLICGNMPVNDIALYLDNILIARNAFDRAGFLFFVFDINTGKPLQTNQIASTGYGEYGNVIRTTIQDVKIIEFNTTRGEDRQSMIEFMDNTIPDNAYVIGYTMGNPRYDLWASDFNTYGKTLQQAFLNQGLNRVNGLNNTQDFIFFYQKNNNNFINTQRVIESTEVLDSVFLFTGQWDRGSIVSPLIGPAQSWGKMTWDWNALEMPLTDSAYVNIYGIDSNNQKTVLYNVYEKGDQLLEDVDATKYPFIQMELFAEDLTKSTAPQLDFWRVVYAQLPEAAVNTGRFLQYSGDTIDFGDTYNVKFAVDNISSYDMDSLLVKFTLTDGQNNSVVSYKRYPKLLATQTYNIDFSYQFVNITNYGTNILTVEINPDGDQREQYHFNNYAVFKIFIDRDRVNPLMDVTFDGRHITDGEIISPTPEILIRLKDENKYLALNDTTAFEVYLKSPNDLVPQFVDPKSDIFTFIPADNSQLNSKNEAKLFYRPNLLEDGTYELRVQAVDRSNNDAGKYEYRIKFNVDGKPSISNFLNYPNPFSTQTQFVFTLTGTTVPEDIRIQIFTVTGKLVKEINKQELGDIFIGTNITNYRWDGTDNYGDKLANGVYFYKVIAKLDGKSMDKYSLNSDKYFEKGIGKLYIAR